MNKIYSLVWNHSRKQVEVASELARSHGGGATNDGAIRSHRCGRVSALALGACMALGMAAPLWAQVTVQPGDTVTYTNSDGNLVISKVGTGSTYAMQLNLANTLNVNSIQVGLAKIDASGIDAGNQKIINVANGSVAVGSTDAVNGGQLNTTNQSVAANTSAIATNTGNIAALQTSTASLQNNALLWNGTAYDAKHGATAQRIVNVAAGTAATDAVNKGQLDAVQSAANAASTAANGKIDNLGANAASIFGGGAVYNTVTGKLSSPTYTITTGQGTTTVNNVGDALALMNGINPGGGGPVTASGIKYFHANSTAADSQAKGADSLAIGPVASVDATSASGIALGNGAAVNQNSANTVAIGTGAHSAPVESPAGSGNYTPVTNAVALGTQAVVSGSDALAFGHSASAGTGGVGVGGNASASGANAVGIGTSASAAGGNATAIGNTAQALGGSSVALGDGAQAVTDGTVSIGQNAGQGDGSIVAGTYRDLVNIGHGAGQNVNGRENIAIGLNAGSGVTGDQNIAMGTAAGSGITGGGRNNVALGFEANQNAGAINNAVAVGATSQASTDGVAVGFAATSTNTGVAIGRQATTSGAGGVALGFNTQADGNFVALGQNASATASDVSGSGYITGSAFSGGAVSVGNANTATPQYRRIVNVADGAQPHDAVNVEQLRGAQQAVANMVGGGMTVNPNGSYSGFEAIGSSGQPVKDSNGNPVTFSSVSQALGDLASGNLTIVPGGTGNIVTYNGAGQIPNVAAGTNGTDAVNVNQLNSVVQQNKTHYYSVNSSQATQTINYDNDGAIGANASAMGPAAQASGVASLAVGLNTVTKNTATGATAIGNHVTADGVSSTAIGSDQTYAWDDRTVAIGSNANARDENSIVIGTNAQSNRTTSPTGNVKNSIVLGTSAISSAEEGVAVGLQATASGTRAMAQGHMALASATDAQASGSNAQATATNASAQGTGANAGAGDAFAMGTSASAGAASAYALGNAAVAAAANSYAVGSGAKTGGNANDSQAVGTNAQTYSSNDIAFGNGAVAGNSANPTGSSNHIAVGAGANVTGDHAVAIGAGNSVAQANTFVLGGNVTTTQANSVVLGNQSTDRAATTETTNTFSKIKYNYAGPGAPAQGVVSMGSKGGERQVINVAAGNISASSTDAVNGSQLYATDVALGNVANSAVAILGGNATLTSTGTITMSNIAGTGKNNVNDAITAARTTLTAGTNVTSVNEASSNGHLGYKIDADGTSVSQGSSAVTVTKGAKDGNNVTNYAVDLSAATKQTLDNAVQYNDGTHTSVTLGGAGAATPVALGNVAAGAVTSTSTDAVNGSQLYAVQQQANSPLTFAGDNGASNNVQRKLGQTLNVTGGGTAASGMTTGNIAVEGNGTDTLSIQLAQALNLGTAGSLTTGNTVVNNSGVTVNGGSNPVTLTNAGLDNGGNQITNVASGGTTTTNAANIGDVQKAAAASASVVAAGTNVASVGTAVAADGHTTYTVNADGASVSQGSSAVTVTKGTPDANNVTDYAVDLSAATKQTLDNAVQYNDGTHTSVTLGGAGATTPVALGNVAAGAVTSTSTDAVNGSQLYAVQQQANSPLTFAGDNGASNNVQRKLGQTLNVTGGGTAASGMTTGNIAVEGNGTDTLSIQLAQALNLGTAGSLTTGNTVVNNSGVTVNGGSNPVTLTNAGLDNGGNQITNVASGGTTTTNAANIGDVQKAAAASASVVAAGTNVASVGTAVAADGHTTYTVNADGASVSAGSSAVSVTKGTPDANNVTDYAVDLSAATKQTLDNAVQYNDGSHTSVTLGGAGATTPVALGNVAAGALTATSTDAVNGSQLYATNQSISNIVNGKAGAFVSDNSVTSTAPVSSGANAAAGGFGASATGAASTVIGNQATDNGNADATVLGQGASIAANTAGSNVALGQGSTVTAAAVATPSGAINGTTYNYAGGTPAGVVSVGSAGNERQLTNVAAGQVTAASTDAVNGSQLYATNTAITAVGTTVTNLGNSVATGLGGTSSYDPSTGTLTTALSVGGNTYGDVNSALNAVNATASKGWDVTTAATGTGVANGSSVANVAPGGTHTITAGDNIVTTQTGTDVAIGVNPVLTGLTSIALASGPSISSSGIDMGNTRIANLAPGSAGTDAVNLNQLNAAIAGVTSGDKWIVGNPTTYAAPSATGSDALAAGSGATATGSNGLAVGNNSQAGGNGSTAVGTGANASADGSTAIGQGATASTANSVALGAGSTTGTAVGVSSATVGGITYGGFAGSAPVGVVSVGSAGNERQLTNVAAGQVTATSTDAVNGSQLYSVANQVSQISTAVGDVANQVNTNTGDIKNLQNGSTGMFQVSADSNTTQPTATGSKSTAGGNGAVASGNGSTAMGNDAQATADNSVAIGANSVADRANSVSVGAAGAARQITNVAAGTAPTDAVNVSQLQASQAGIVHYDTNPDGSVNYDSITLNPGGGSTSLHNVAPGTVATDAANVGQLQQVQNWSKSYTDRAVNNLGHQAFAGVASAIAAASLPQAYQPNQSSAGVALGNFHGESGIAVGLSTISESGRVIFKVNASTNTRGDAGVGVGAGVVW